MACGHLGGREQNLLDRGSMHSGTPSPSLALSGRSPGTSAQLPPGGTGRRYLVPFIAPPSAHPVGPHGGEEGQVVAIGLCQEHRLPRVQGKAGAGVPLLRNSGATERVKNALGRACCLCLWGPAPSSRTLAQGLYEFLVAAVTTTTPSHGLTDLTDLTDLEADPTRSLWANQGVSRAAFPPRLRWKHVSCTSSF